MTRQIRRRRGRGTLHLIAGLLVASAIVRIGAQSGPALAEGATMATEVEPETTPPVETDALLAAFQAREARLVTQEAQLRDRLQALRVAEVEIEEKLQALRDAEEALSATIALAESASETDLAQLTTVYENMKPKDAAALFEEMTPQFAAGFLGLMRPDAAAQIMTELEPETAYSFSVVLAGRNANVPTQ
ncbi:magnesium transporter MgtE N-terminal domain-containing protein [Yoonia sp. BS5-3]|uniref:MotE family protein n=1 Tax=Yoonia phaeophyticola TaxID=3137369 RepID=A0ABZ2V5W8_9RHOB